MSERPASENFAALPFAIPADRWDDAAASEMSPEDLLLYRSNLLGADLTITNFGGGNTSGKLPGIDPLSGADVTVLWVKGSGGDIGSMKRDGFSTLYLDRLLGLEALYRGIEHEDEMVGYLPHCTFALNPRAASIDTPLHAYLPFAHVDHVHPDAVIALAASSNGEAATREIWGGRIGWLSWKRPGFALGLQLRDLVQASPELEGVVLAGHGLICWGDDARACYRRTVRLISDAAGYLNTSMKAQAAFGGRAVEPRDPNARRAAMVALMPRLRGLVGTGNAKVMHVCDDPETMEFVCARDFAPLAALGTSCPDHFLRTKIAPLVLDPAHLEDQDYLAGAVEQYRTDYAAYYSRCAVPGDPPMRDANPVIVLIPGIDRKSVV